MQNSSYLAGYRFEKEAEFWRNPEQKVDWSNISDLGKNIGSTWGNITPEWQKGIATGGGALAGGLLGKLLSGNWGGAALGALGGGAAGYGLNRWLNPDVNKDPVTNEEQPAATASNIKTPPKQQAAQATQAPVAAPVVPKTQAPTLPSAPVKPSFSALSAESQARLEALKKNNMQGATPQELAEVQAAEKQYLDSERTKWEQQQTEARNEQSAALARRILQG